MLRGDSFHDRQRALDSGQFIWPKRVAFTRILPGQLAVACNTCFTPECSFLGGTYFNPLKTTLVRCKKVQAHHPSFNDNFHSSRPIPAIFGAFITECMCHRSKNSFNSHLTITGSECCLTKLVPYIFVEKCIYISALEMASPGNQHCASCIGTMAHTFVRRCMLIGADGARCRIGSRYRQLGAWM